MSGHEAVYWSIAFAIVVATICGVVWGIIQYRDKIKFEKAYDEHLKRLSEESARLKKDKSEKEKL